MRIVVSPRKVHRQGKRYSIPLPKEIGKALHGKLVQVTIEVLEPLEKGD